MSQEVSYTAEEIAKLLKISKLTVYDLIKKGELPSYRVGKQMRVDASDLEAYKQRSRTAAPYARGPERAAAGAPPAYDGPAGFSAPYAGSAAGAAESVGLGTAASAAQPAGLGTAPEAAAGAAAGAARPSGASAYPLTAGAAASLPVVITGQDMSLDILARHLEQANPGMRPLRSQAGSLEGLIGLFKGEADVASTHLLDGDTGEYNLPYIRKLLVGFPYIVVNLLSRQAGLYTAKGNPLALRAWSDLARPGLRIACREPGSGARVLLDEQLRLHGLKPAGLAGGRVLTNHLSVAAAVASGEADLGVGTERAASIVGGVDFVPLIQERYDLVIVKKPQNAAWISSLLDIVRSAAFRQELGAIAGYDLTDTGRILLET